MMDEYIDASGGGTGKYNSKKDGRGSREERRRKNDPMNYRRPLEAVRPDYSHISTAIRSQAVTPNEEGADTEQDLAAGGNTGGDSNRQVEEHTAGDIIEYLKPNAEEYEAQSSYRVSTQAKPMGWGQERRGASISDGPASSTSVASGPKAFTPSSRGASKKAASGRQQQRRRKWAKYNLAGDDSTPAITSNTQEGLDIDSQASAPIIESTTQECEAYFLQRSQAAGLQISESQDSQDATRNTSSASGDGILNNLASESRQTTKSPQLDPQTQVFSPAPGRLYSSSSVIPQPSEAPVLSSLHKINDSKIQTEKLGAIMGDIDDAFDVEEWDPNLPPAGITNSPEEMTVAPKAAMAYTTVGSLVTTTTPAQFNAPVRIQRDGNARRFPLGGIAARSNNPYSNTAPRGISMSGNHGGTNQYNSYQSSQNRPGHMVNDFEDSRGQHSGGGQFYHMGERGGPRSRNIDPMSSRGRLHPDEERQRFNRDQLHDERDPISRNIEEHNKRTAKAQSQEQMTTTAGGRPVKAVIPDRMQSLQNLIKIPNSDYQQQIQNRLSDAQANVEAACNSNTKVLPPSGKQVILWEDAQEARSQLGRLQTDYKFPITTPSGQSDQGLQSSNALSGRGQSGYYNNVPGRPQPLKAGPPGQRSAGPVSTSGWAERDPLGPQIPNEISPIPRHSRFRPPTQHSTDSVTASPWADMPSMGSGMTNRSPFGVFPATLRPFAGPGGGNSTPIKDTLSIGDMMKYYPNGLPTHSNYAPTGFFTPLSEVSKIEMGTSNLTMKEAQAKDAMTGFRSGWQDLMDSTPDSPGKEADERYFAEHGHKKARPIMDPIGTGRLPKTIKEVQDMTEAEATAPLLGFLYNSMSGYAANGAEPGPKAQLSGWERAHPDMIDETEEGNQSFLGGGSGVRPPKDAPDKENGRGYKRDDGPGPGSSAPSWRATGW